MTKAEVAKLSDDQVLELAGSFGPAIIGEHLHARAQTIQKDNPGGALGPAIVGDSSKTEEPDAPALPSIPNLAAHIAKMSVSEVEALQKVDARKTAVPIYEARLDELAQ